MKFRKINILTTLALATAISFTACSKDDGAIPKNVGIEDVPVVSTNMEAGSSTSITFSNLAAFQGNFKVWMYFAGATPPTKIDVVGRKRNGTIGTTKVFKADVTTLPLNVTFTAADLATFNGGPLALKDTFDFAPDIYVGTKKYETWPAVGAGNGSGVTGMSIIGFGEFVRYIVK